MAITTYAELKTAIGNWTARDDLTSYYDEFIDLAETFLKREPAPSNSPDIGGIRSNISRTTGTLSIGTATLSLPADYLEMYRLNLTGDNYTVLRFLAPNELSLHRRSGKGLPSFYTISDVIELNVAPDAAYAYELSYWPQITALSDSATTNWVLTNYPDVYLSATLFHAFTFIQDDARAANSLGQYKSGSWSASETYRQGRVTQGSVAIKTDSPTP